MDVMDIQTRRHDTVEHLHSVVSEACDSLIELLDKNRAGQESNIAAAARACVEFGDKVLAIMVACSEDMERYHADLCQRYLEKKKSLEDSKKKDSKKKDPSEESVEAEAEEEEEESLDDLDLEMEVGDVAEETEVSLNQCALVKEMIKESSKEVHLVRVKLAK